MWAAAEGNEQRERQPENSAHTVISQHACTCYTRLISVSLQKEHVCVRASLCTNPESVTRRG